MATLVSALSYTGAPAESVNIFYPLLAYVGILAKCGFMDVSDGWGIIRFGRSYGHHGIKLSLPQYPADSQPGKQEEDKDEQLE